MTKQAQIKLIDMAFYKLNFLGARYGRMEFDQYYKLNLQEERDHDRYRLSGTKRGLTIPQAARLFCVKQIAEYMIEGKQPDPKFYISDRKSIYHAWSIYANYKEELEKALDGVDLQALVNIDYAELNQ